MRQRLLFFAWFVLMSMAGFASAAHEVLWETTLTEYLGHTWTGELLRYRLTKETALPAEYSLMVTDGTGTTTPVAVQLEPVAGAQSPDRHVYDLYCVLDLAPYQTRKLQLLKGKAPVALSAALSLESNGKTITASNGTFEVQIPDSIPDGRGLTETQIPAPLLRIRNVRQQEWGGAGAFTNVGGLLELRTKVTTRGPVFTDIAMDYRFAQGRYFAALRLIRDQPLVLWRDETKHDNPAAMLTWDFSPGFAPQTAFPFQGKDARGRATFVALPVKNVLAQGVGVSPGNPWLELRPLTSSSEPVEFNGPSVEKAGDLDIRGNDGLSHPEKALDNASAVGKPNEPQWVIGIFSGNPRDWKIEESQHPIVPFWYSLPVLKVAANTHVLMDLPLFDGKRSLGVSVDEAAGRAATRSIQYGQTPLNEVKEYVLDYDQDLQDTFPRRFFNETERRERATALDANSPFYANIQQARDACSTVLAGQPFKEVADWLNTWDLTTPTIWSPWQDRDLIVAALYGKDDRFAPLLRMGAMASARRFTDHFFEPIPSDRTWVSSWFGGELGISVVDSGSRYLTPEQFRRVRARMLFMAYKLASDMFEYSRTGRGAPLNMCRTHVNGFLGSIALLYPHHPKAREWIETAKKEMVFELTECNGPNGGWVEAPHYMTVSMDYLVAFALDLARAGEEDLLYHERLKQTVLWLAKISTPRDLRSGNRRHFPEIGNTYRNEATVLFSLMARAYRRRDPAYADAMQWIWNEMGRPMWLHIGGTVPLTEGYREALVDFTPSPTSPPAWKSEWFRDSGVVLRSHFATARENYLYLIQGNMHEHYDKDNGSIIVWGKGRPLCEDWGYNCGPGGPISEHSRMDIGGEGKVTAFAALDAIDYVHSSQGPWDRQILFMKDADPLGPNYFLLRDSTAISGTTTWSAGVTPFRLWPTSPYVVSTGTNEWRLWVNIDPNTQLAANDRLITACGRDDVDMDIWFDDASLKLLRKIRQPSKIGKTEEPLTPDSDKRDDWLAETPRQDDETHQPWIYDTEKKTVWVITGNNQGYWGNTGLEQRCINMRVPRGHNVVTLLYPRLRGEQKPGIESYAHDRALEIISPAGKDFVFLSLEPMEANVKDLRFQGTVGAVQQRLAEQVFSLGAAGEIVGKEYGLSAPGPASLRVGKDVLTIGLPVNYPGGQVVLMAPDGYKIETATSGVTLEKHDNGRYLLAIPIGLTGVVLKK